MGFALTSPRRPAPAPATMAARSSLVGLGEVGTGAAEQRAEGCAHAWICGMGSGMGARKSLGTTRRPHRGR